MAFNSILKNIRILLLDPERDRADYTREVLNGAGLYSVRTARDSNVAVDMLVGSQFDVALVELGPKDTKGRDFLRILRDPKSSPARNLPVLAMLPAATREDVRVVIRLGVDHVLIRPFSANDVLNRLESVSKSPAPRHESEDYIGPDRRRVPDQYYQGTKRRTQD